MVRPRVRKEIVCKRCDHRWLPKSMKTAPARCPKCKSPYWWESKSPNHKAMNVA